MEDYFHYDVLYQINITDVDDKIILRARRNELIAQYVAAEHPTDKIAADVDAAAAALSTKLEAKLAELQEPLPAGSASRLVEEREKLVKEQELKNARHFGEVVPAIAAAKDAGRDALLAAGRDVLAAKLDAEYGHTVTDNKIFEAHARRFEREYMDDMDALGVRPPDVLTRVTEYIPEIVAFVQNLVERGFAYEAGGSVYQDLQKFSGCGHDYRKCKPARGAATTAAEMAESEGALKGGGVKRHPNDFALWKASKPGEPSWPSPWGEGRPGWHIECSVIASDILGKNLDIHSGGIDLTFPHHDNELAQSESRFDIQQWVNYFTHAGHLEIRGLKMSKSLKNFVTIRQALQEHTPRQLRLMFLLQAWDKSMKYSDQTVEDAKSKEQTFKNFFNAVKVLMRQPWLDSEIGWRAEGSQSACMGVADRKLAQELLKQQGAVHAALLDNFNTCGAVLALYDLVSATNKYMDAVGADAAVLLVRRVGEYVTKILRVLGVVEGNDSVGFGAAGAEGGAGKEETLRPVLDAFVGFRGTVREAALAERKSGGSGNAAAAVLEACDAVRDTSLVDCGVRLMDRGDTAVWSLDDPATLRKEIDDRRRKQEEALAKKRANQLKLKKKELGKWETARVAPATFFSVGQYAGQYTAYAESGVPTKDAKGEELKASQTKKLKKLLDKHAKVHKDLLTKAGGDVEGFIGALRAEVEALESGS